MNENKDMLMDWNDSIETDGQDFILLPEGDYNFTVTNFERGRFPGGPKVPACNKASITVQVDTKEGLAIVKFDLLLYRSLEWRISAFFRCIGQKKHGEKLTMTGIKSSVQTVEHISNNVHTRIIKVTRNSQTILIDSSITTKSSLSHFHFRRGSLWN